MKTINALAFRKKFGGILDEVANKKETIAITRANKTLAVLLPLEEYEQHFNPEKKKKQIGKAIKKIKQLRESLAPFTQGLDSTELLRQMREER